MITVRMTPMITVWVSDVSGLVMCCAPCDHESQSHSIVTRRAVAIAAGKSWLSLLFGATVGRRKAWLPVDFSRIRGLNIER